MKRFWIILLLLTVFVNGSVESQWSCNYYIDGQFASCSDFENNGYVFFNTQGDKSDYRYDVSDDTLIVLDNFDITVSANDNVEAELKCFEAPVIETVKQGDYRCSVIKVLVEKISSEEDFVESPDVKVKPKECLNTDDLDSLRFKANNYDNFFNDASDDFLDSDDFFVMLEKQNFCYSLVADIKQSNDDSLKCNDSLSPDSVKEQIDELKKTKELYLSIIAKENINKNILDCKSLMKEDLQDLECGTNDDFHGISLKLNKLNSGIGTQDLSQNLVNGLIDGCAKAFEDLTCNSDMDYNNIASIINWQNQLSENKKNMVFESSNLNKFILKDYFSNNLFEKCKAKFYEKPVCYKKGNFDHNSFIVKTFFDPGFESFSERFGNNEDIKNSWMNCLDWTSSQIQTDCTTKNYAEMSLLLKDIKNKYNFYKTNIDSDVRDIGIESVEGSCGNFIKMVNSYDQKGSCLIKEALNGKGECEICGGFKILVDQSKIKIKGSEYLVRDCCSPGNYNKETKSCNIVIAEERGDEIVEESESLLDLSKNFFKRFLKLFISDQNYLELKKKHISACKKEDLRKGRAMSSISSIERCENFGGYLCKETDGKIGCFKTERLD